MSQTKTNSFIKQFTAYLKGDTDASMAEKAWRGANSALKGEISLADSETMKLEDAVDEAKENLQVARINGGNPVKDRNYYIKALIEAKNKLTKAEKDLKDHNAMVEFLTTELAELSK